LNAEEQRLAYKLQGSTLFLTARVHSIDARLVFACGKLWGVKDETVHLVFGMTGSLHIRSRRIGGTVSRKLPINVELHLDVRLRFCEVHHPAFDMLRVSHVQPSSKVRSERCQVKAYCKRAYEQ